MATIRPFRAFHFSDRTGSDPNDLIAPPYDVISSEEAESLRALPFNITHLTLPVDRDDRDRYRVAADTLDTWIERGILEPEDDPALYLYEQEFNDPVSGARVMRRGFVTRLQLVEFGPGGVLPHERTLSKHREDRFRLRQAAGADLEPIFGMYPGTDVVEILADAADPAPEYSVSDAGGVMHRVWTITDREAIDHVAAELSQREVFIVDGHHRYITALEHSRGAGFGEDHPLASIMIFLCSMENPGLVILPTHRIVHSIAADRISDVIERLDTWFLVEGCASREEAFEQLSRKSDGIWFALLSKGRNVLIQPRDEVVAQVAGTYPPGSPVAGLDVTILHDFIFEDLLGISRSEQEQGTHIRYSRNDREAIAAADDREVALVVGMRPPSISDVEAVARAGEVMPQKSTYFYPKLASGLLLNVSEDRPPVES